MNQNFQDIMCYYLSNLTAEPKASSSSVLKGETTFAHKKPSEVIAANLSVIVKHLKDCPLSQFYLRTHQMGRL